MMQIFTMSRKCNLTLRLKLRDFHGIMYGTYESQKTYKQPLITRLALQNLYPYLILLKVTSKSFCHKVAP